MSTKDAVLENSYWNDFYNKWVIDIPSQFCVQMATEIGQSQTIVEFGSGNGRDTHYLANQGYLIVAMDLSNEAVLKSRAKMSERDIEHAFLLSGDVSKESDVVSALTLARDKTADSGQGLIIYSRFLMHSLDDTQEAGFLSALSNNLHSGDRVYFEFRSKEDATTTKIYGDHYRRYVDSAKFSEQMQTDYGFNIDYQITGQGLAKYKAEDPFITRIIATKKAATSR